MTSDTTKPKGKVIAVGCGKVAIHYLGEDTPQNRRRIYYWHERGRLHETFKLGNQLCVWTDEGSPASGGVK